MGLGFHPLVPSSWERAQHMETVRNRQWLLGMFPLQPGKCFHPSLECNERTLFGLWGCKCKPLLLCLSAQLSNNFWVCSVFFLLLRICPFLISSYFMWFKAYFLSPQPVPIDSQVSQKSVSWPTNWPQEIGFWQCTNTVSCCQSHSSLWAHPHLGICILATLYLSLEGILFCWLKERDSW